MRERSPRREGLVGPCVHGHLTNCQERGKRPQREGRQGLHPKPEIIDTLCFQIQSILLIREVSFYLKIGCYFLDPAVSCLVVVPARVRHIETCLSVEAEI